MVSSITGRRAGSTARAAGSGGVAVKAAAGRERSTGEPLRSMLVRWGV